MWLQLKFLNGNNMRIVKGLIIGFVGLFIMITMISLLIPSQVITVKSTVVRVPREKVFQQIADLKNWRNWHPVFKSDAGFIFSNPSSIPQAYALWSSNGKTNKIVLIDTASSGIRFLLIRPGEKDVENIMSIRPTEDSLGLQVEWKALTHLKWYPWEKFAGIFIDKMTGPGYEAALTSLQQYLEQQPKTAEWLRSRE